MQEANEKIYDKYLRNALLLEGSLHSQNAINFLVGKEDFIIPSDIFTFIALKQDAVNFDTLCILLQQRIYLDNYITSIVNICKRNNLNLLSLKKLDSILTICSFEKNLSRKLYLLKLLAGSDTCVGVTLKEYPLENIVKYHKNVLACVDDFICQTGFLADFRRVKICIEAIKTKQVKYLFQPFANTKHNDIMQWLKRNIAKGRNDAQAILGWECGPDSGRWPSTVLDDYEITLNLLCSISDN